MWNPWSFGTLLLLPVQVVGPRYFYSTLPVQPSHSYSAQHSYSAVWILLQHLGIGTFTAPKSPLSLVHLDLRGAAEDDEADLPAPGVGGRGVALMCQWETIEMRKFKWRVNETCKANVFTGLGFCFCGFLSLRTTPWISRRTRTLVAQFWFTNDVRNQCQNDITLKGASLIWKGPIAYLVFYNFYRFPETNVWPYMFSSALRFCVAWFRKDLMSI